MLRVIVLLHYPMSPELQLAYSLCVYQGIQHNLSQNPTEYLDKCTSCLQTISHYMMQAVLV